MSMKKGNPHATRGRWSYLMRIDNVIPPPPEWFYAMDDELPGGVT